MKPSLSSLSFSSSSPERIWERPLSSGMESLRFRKAEPSPSLYPDALFVSPSLQGSRTLTLPDRYLCEHYDRSHRLLPIDETQRVKVREWIHVAEGAFMIHCLPIVSVRRIDASAAEKLAPGLAGNVAKDLDWLEAELRRGNGRYLVGDHVTAACGYHGSLLHSIHILFETGAAR